jgi:hypothetical protein
MRRSYLLHSACLAFAAISISPAIAENAAPSPAVAPQAAGAKDVQVLSCGGPFAADTSEAKLKAAFGEKNVAFKSVPGPEGMEMNATVVFPDDPARRVTVMWNDEAKRSGLANASIQVDWQSDPDGENPWKTEILWQTDTGIKIGTDIETLEKLNGKPFKLGGFGWDYGGYIQDWNGGALENKPGCFVSVRMMQSASDAPESVLGEVDLTSDMADVRKAKPKVTEISIGYPVE